MFTPAEFHYAIAKEWRFFECSFQKITNLVKEFDTEYSNFITVQFPTLINKLKMPDVTFSKAYNQSDIINTFKNLKENATTIKNKQEVMDHYKMWDNTYKQRCEYYNSTSNEQKYKLKLDISNKILKILSQSR